MLVSIKVALLEKYPVSRITQIESHFFDEPRLCIITGIRKVCLKFVWVPPEIGRNRPKHTEVKLFSQFSDYRRKEE
jgi:hypothetical protein